MAVSTNSYFSNSICGVPSVGGEAVDLLQTNTVPKFPLGQKYEREDSAVFRYGYFSSATSAGSPVASTRTDINLTYAAASTSVTPSSTYQMAVEPVGVYPGSIGSRFIVAAITGNANQYAGGYVSIADGVGAGYTYRIKGNTVYGSPAALLLRLELYDQIKVALTLTSVVNVIGCRYNSLAVADTTNANVVGSSMVAATAGVWGWVQTQGYATYLSDNATTPTFGQLVTLSATTAGCVTAWAVGTSALITNATAGYYPIVGNCIGVSAAGKYLIVDTELE